MRRLFSFLLACLLGCSAFAYGEEKITYRNVELKDNGTYLDMGTTKIGDMDKFRRFLGQNPELQRVDMYQTRISLKTMEELRAQFPLINFGCTFSFVRGSISTNTEAYSTFNRLSDPRYPSSRFEALKYCPDIKALDLGHHKIKELEFLLPLSQMRILILAVCKIDNIDVLSTMKDLEYLELFNNDIMDLSPLAELQNLQHLNLCHNPFTDITPLLKLKNLKRLWLSKNHLTDEQIDLLEKSLPDCTFFYSWGDCTGGGWRSEGPYYKTIMKIFKSGVYEPFPQ